MSLSGDGHGARLGVDVHLTEELIGAAGRWFGLGRRFLVHHLHATGGVGLGGATAIGIQRARDKLPKRRAVFVLCRQWVNVMGCDVVHIGGEPHDILNVGALDLLQQADDSQLSTFCDELGSLATREVNLGLISVGISRSVAWVWLGMAHTKYVNLLG